jgi:protein TonB
MRILLLFIPLLAFMMPVSSTAQTEEPIYVSVDQMPEFPGGPNGLGNFFRSNLAYPRPALDAKIEGIVIASFIVEKDGKVSKPAIVKGLGNGCDEEVLRLIGMMPAWKPGIKDGKEVRVKLSVPVEFKLR